MPAQFLQFAAFLNTRLPIAVDLVSQNGTHGQKSTKICDSSFPERWGLLDTKYSRSKSWHLRWDHPGHLPTTRPQLRQASRESSKYLSPH